MKLSRKPCEPLDKGWSVKFTEEIGVSEVTPQNVGGAVALVITVNGVPRTVTTKFRPAVFAVNRLVPKAVTGVVKETWITAALLGYDCCTKASPVPKLAQGRVLVSHTCSQLGPFVNPRKSTLPTARPVPL